MYIIIKRPVNYTKKDIESRSTYIGIGYTINRDMDGHMVYKVVDEKVFMLSVIKYGIEYEKLKY
jgi:hypothetical protein